MMWLFNPDCPCCTVPSISNGCCSGALYPDVLHVTFSNSGNCADIDGETKEITWDSLGQYWEVVLPNECHAFGGNQDLRIRFQCAAPAGACDDFLLSLQTEIPGTGVPLDTLNNGTSDSCTCDPLSVTYTMTSAPTTGFGCCNPGGNITVTITE